VAVVSWHRVDDGFPEHAKLAALEADPRLLADAVMLWLFAACYCRRTNTGGFVTHERLARLTPLAARRAKAVAEAMVDKARAPGGDHGLWERVEGGYLFHDWDDYGPSAPPSPGAARTKRWRDKKASQCDAQRDTDRDAQAVTQAVTTNVDCDVTPGRHGDASHKASLAHTAARGRPVPSRPDLDLRGGAQQSARAPEPPLLDGTTTTSEPTSDWARFGEHVWRKWSKRFADAKRGQFPRKVTGELRDVTTALYDQAQRDGLSPHAYGGAVLDLYWAEEWPNDKSNTPSLRNLYAQLDRLMLQVRREWSEHIRPTGDAA
jgi:hypothetical protein